MSSGWNELSDKMRSDWDRRIQHDYRFWMSDGIKDDKAMWASGERDFEILMRGITTGSDKTFLEIGCGVGRLLKAAVAQFGKVIGLDVSPAAIKKADEFLSEYRSTLSLIVGNGTDLSQIPDQSVDVVVSFASITSMPTPVIAQYLLEARRVLAPEGVVRLQMYLGSEQEVSENDTLHLRCFDRARLEAAAILAGFSVSGVEELILPFEVSFKQLGIEAFIVTLSPTLIPSGSVTDIVAALVSDDEKPKNDISPIEFWMAYNHAKTMILEGDFERAERALLYAADVAKATSMDVADLLNEIVQHLDAVQGGEIPKKNSPKIFEENMTVLKARFPDVAEQLTGVVITDATRIVVTMEGPTLLYQGLSLDHAEKPKTSGEVWARRTLADSRATAAEALFVFGFSLGYHIEALLAESRRPLSVIEPSLEVFKIALQTRDLRSVLSGLQGLWVGTMPHDPELIEKAELFPRPQHQSMFGEASQNTKAYFYGARGIAKLKPAIGVLGPLQGGTLPITGYTHRALSVISQKGREINVSGFALGFHEVEKLVHDEMRKAIVQSQYIQFVSGAVLESINEKPIDILICMAQAPVTIELLVELRKRGIITVLWFAEDYLRFTYWKELGSYFDFIFTIQKDDCLTAIKKSGAGSVHYLPMACDPAIHAPQVLTEDEKRRWGSPLSFVGAGYHNRQQLFASMADFPIKLWGTEWPTCRPFDSMVQEQGRRLSPEEYTKIFNATDININLHSSNERDGVDPYGDFVNPRTFELASAGAFQLVDERTLLPEMFTPGKELVTFKDLPDLKEKIHYYLEHPAERKAIAEAGKKRVLQEHTYAHRIRQMLTTIYSEKFEHLKARADKSPWEGLRKRATNHSELSQRVEKAFLRGEEPKLDGIVSDIQTGKGELTDTEQKLLFLHHIRSQMIRMKREESGER